MLFTRHGAASFYQTFELDSPELVAQKIKFGCLAPLDVILKRRRNAGKDFNMFNN
jgi:hypothetical protein